MHSILLIALLGVAAAPQPDEDLSSENVHAAPAMPGLKGACAGGACGFCVGFGLPGFCVGSILGSYVQDLREENDELKDIHEKELELKIREKKLECEQTRSAAPQGSEAAKVDCEGISRPTPFRQVALGVAGSGGAVALVVAGVLLGAASAAGGVFVTSRASSTIPALAGLSFAAVLLGGAFLVANIVAMALWAPFGMWFVQDRLEW